jgi:hypothetical protein
MGSFDNVKCNVPLPDGRTPPGRWFQTKSLYRRMERFTITDQGRLIHHQCRLEEAGKREIRPGLVFPKYRSVAVADVDMDYHGDILLCGTVDAKYAEFVARFAHGTLEWIRPFESLAEVHRTWLSGD